MSDYSKHNVAIREGLIIKSGKETERLISFVSSDRIVIVKRLVFKVKEFCLKQGRP